MKITLIGYYGRKNIGDDLMMTSLINFIKDNYKVVNRIDVMVHEKSIIEENLENVKFIQTNNKLKYIYSIITSDILIWGGGTCLYDPEGPRMPRGLKDFSRIQFLSKLFRTKFVFLGIGIGKLSSRVSLHVTKILNESYSASFRDTDSLNIARKLIPHNNFMQCGDLSLLSLVHTRHKKKLVDQEYVTYSGVKDYGNAKDAANFLNKVCGKNNLKVFFLPCHQGIISDNDTHHEISQYLEVDWEILYPNSETEFIRYVNGAFFHFGVRLHSLVIADICGVPNIGLNYSPKIRSYIKQTRVLIEKRVVNSWSNVCLSDISLIKREYRKPKEFLVEQNKKTKEVLDAVFQK